MAFHSTTVPALNLVANAGAALHPPAPGVLAGQPINHQTIAAAAAEYQDRKRERELTGNVTQAEICDAKRRKLALEIDGS